MDVKPAHVSIPELPRASDTAETVGTHPVTGAEVRLLEHGARANFEPRDLSQESRAFGDRLIQALARPVAFASRKVALLTRPKPKPARDKKAKSRELSERARKRAKMRAPVVVATPRGAGQALRSAVILQIDGDGRVVSSSARDSLVTAAIKQIEAQANSEVERQALTGEIVAALIQQHLQSGGL